MGIKKEGQIGSLFREIATFAGWEGQLAPAFYWHKIKTATITGEEGQLAPAFNWG